MEIIISNASDKPIYEQIASQIKDAVLAGELSAGDALPSIRALANDLHVSVITTKRAYSDLESLGFIETVQGTSRRFPPHVRRTSRLTSCMTCSTCSARLSSALLAACD